MSKLLDSIRANLRADYQVLRGNSVTKRGLGEERKTKILDIIYRWQYLDTRCIGVYLGYETHTNTFSLTQKSLSDINRILRKMVNDKLLVELNISGNPSVYFLTVKGRKQHRIKANINEENYFYSASVSDKNLNVTAQHHALTALVTYTHTKCQGIYLSDYEVNRVFSAINCPSGIFDKKKTDIVKTSKYRAMRVTRKRRFPKIPDAIAYAAINGHTSEPTYTYDLIEMERSGKGINILKKSFQKAEAMDYYYFEDGARYAKYEGGQLRNFYYSGDKAIQKLLANKNNQTFKPDKKFHETHQLAMVRTASQRLGNDITDSMGFFKENYFKSERKTYANIIVLYSNAMIYENKRRHKKIKQGLSEQTPEQLEFLNISLEDEIKRLKKEVSELTDRYETTCEMVDDDIKEIRVLTTSVNQKEHTINQLKEQNKKLKSKLLEEHQHARKATESVFYELNKFYSTQDKTFKRHKLSTEKIKEINKLCERYDE